MSEATFTRKDLDDLLFEYNKAFYNWTSFEERQRSIRDLGERDLFRLLMFSRSLLTEVEELKKAAAVQTESPQETPAQS